MRRNLFPEAAEPEVHREEEEEEEEDDLWAVTAAKEKKTGEEG